MHLSTICSIIYRPLIVICGKPCSGKTSVACQIAEYIRQKGTEPITISLETLGLQRSEAYKSSFDEKNTHEVIKTQVSRLLRNDNFVILDTMNFIKGYRYEMYCIARGCHSTRCVVWVDTPIGMIREYNHSCPHFSDEILEDLSCRFEPPSPLTRWDTPLYRLCLSDSSGSMELGMNKDCIADVEIYKTVPCDAIWESLTVEKAQARHIAINPPAETLSSGDYASFINSTTDEIVKEILKEQNMAGGILGSKLKVTGANSFVILYKHVTSIQLKTWRKQFLAIITKQQIGKDIVASAFISFINTQLKE